MPKGANGDVNCIWQRGAESVIEYELTSDERAALGASTAAVKELCEAVDRLLETGFDLG